MTMQKQRSGLWYLLPIIFGIFGGIIAWFVIRDDDPKKASNCLWLGVILIIIEIIFGWSLF
jgi:xanthine/uracil permease